MNDSPRSAPPPELLHFLEVFHDGRYWESHEVLEEAWLRSRSDFYQALILYASAFVHRDRRNAHGVRAQLRKALERLERYPDRYLGVDVAGLRAHCRTVRETVGRHPDDWPERVEPFPIAVDPAEIRGDEPELDGP